VNGAGSSQCYAVTAHGSRKSLIYVKSNFFMPRNGFHFAR
jgi:hypothetical protein